MAKFRETIASVLEYWFGEIENELCNEHQQRMWYQFDPNTDKEITNRFSELHALATAGELEHWEASPEGALALIILLDQMSRNMFRGTSGAFEYDDQALEICLRGIKAGYDKQLSLVEVLFFYHPLEHAESIEHQSHCVELMEQLVERYEGALKGYAQNSLNFALEHKEIIDHFGRFPHRNEVLGRVATTEEQEYLASGGKRFGQ